jgi:uncharacterized membrane protein
MAPEASIILFIVIFIVVIGIFLLFRRLTIWYFKIDIIIENMEEQTAILKKIANSLKKENEEIN